MFSSAKAPVYEVIKDQFLDDFVITDEYIVVSDSNESNSPDKD